MEQTIDTLHRRIRDIEERNNHVTHRKQRETCWTRRITIALVTYATIAAYMWALGVRQRYLHALIPTAGFLFSTLSLEWVEKQWIRLQKKKPE